jgi:ABC-2 type transport system ATP-binding protein
MNTPLLDVAEIVKRYDGRVAVDRLSFRVRSGTIFGLLGPNGAGKTTTIRMIMDITAPDEGAIHFSGQKRSEQTNRSIGYLPEERGLYRKMTVRDHLVFFAEIRGLRRADALPRIDRWLERMDLGDRAKKKVEELSKGMQQKVQFIGAVLGEPSLLILDEPFSGLDPISTLLLKSVLQEARGRGTAIIFSTHVLEQAEKLCDDILLIKGGKNVLDGSLSEVRDRFRTPSYLVRGSNLENLGRLESVRDLTIDQDQARVELTSFESGPAFLAAALSVSTLSEFRPVEPDLESIFVKAVGDAMA